MFVRQLGALVLAGGLVFAAGCAERAGEEEAAQADGEGMPAAEQATAPPDTTAAAVWEYLTEVDYRNSWALWPGKGELYQGQEPHGMLLTTYLNPAAHEALTGMAGSMPDRSIIVKENYMPDSTLAAITIMYKAPGFDPEHNNWFWIKQLADGTVQVEGRGQGCINCHGAQSGNDYIFTASLQRAAR